MGVRKQGREGDSFFSIPEHACIIQEVQMICM